MSGSVFQFARTRRGAVAILAILLAFLFFVRPGADGLRSRIGNSISRALGRPVAISSVSFRFLPQPGFDLENFVVYDDPAFSAEPIVRSQEVTASLRMLSLLRGRLEISRLSLTEPSLNLVHTGEGHWNLENLVERAAKIPVAPTSKAKTEPRPGFPYIEASNGRINFKLGQEKKTYALTEADFSLWQDSENTWGMRLKARPVRTDSNVSDTGMVRVEGTWQRAATLAETPLRFNLQWERAQLGQFTKLITGFDRGWRGSVLWSASVTGTPASLEVQTSATIEDFRRYDIVEGDKLRVAAQCSANYDSTTQHLSKLDCQAPVGRGRVQLSGSMGGSAAPREDGLKFTATDIPLPSLILLLRHAKKNVPEDLVSTGKLDVQAELRSKPGTAPVWNGSGSIQEGHLLSPATNSDLVLTRLPFSVTQGNDKDVSPVFDPQLEFGPVHLPLGATAPASVHGTVTRTGYSLQLTGDARIRRLLQAARVLGLPVAQPAADGAAKVDLQVAGEWSGFKPAMVTGKAQVSGARAEIAGVNAPLEIASASITLQPDDLIAQNVTANLGQTTWRGSLSRPRHCAQTSDCVVHFDFQCKELAASQVVRLFVPEARRQPWYRFFSSPQAASALLTNLNAEGRLSTGRLSAYQVVATQVSAKVAWRNRRLQLSDLRGNLFGGTHRGEWTADFSGDSPQYEGKGSLQNAGLRQMAQAMQDEWVTGTGSTSYEVGATGINADEFSASFHGALDITAQGASFAHLALLPSATPLFARRLSGKILLRSGRLEIREGKLETASGIYHVSGTALKGKGLNLQMSKESGRGFNITGTLAAPRVTQALASDTRAALKPQ